MPFKPSRCFLSPRDAFRNLRDSSTALRLFISGPRGWSGRPRKCSRRLRKARKTPFEPVSGPLMTRSVHILITSDTLAMPLEPSQGLFSLREGPKCIAKHSGWYREGRKRHPEAPTLTRVSRTSHREPRTLTREPTKLTRVSIKSTREPLNWIRKPPRRLREVVVEAEGGRLILKSEEWRSHLHSPQPPHRQGVNPILKLARSSHAGWRASSPNRGWLPLRDSRPPPRSLPDR
jgi:hypothetical protein